MVDSKTQWPELEGVNDDEACEMIRKESDNTIEVIKLLENSFVTSDYRTNRVRVYYNKTTKLVVGVPSRG